MGLRYLYYWKQEQVILSTDLSTVQPDILFQNITIKPTFEILNLLVIVNHRFIVKSNTNVTGDYYFFSVELMDELK